MRWTTFRAAALPKCDVTWAQVIDHSYNRLYANIRLSPFIGVEFTCVYVLMSCGMGQFVSVDCKQVLAEIMLLSMKLILLYVLPFG